MGAIFTGVTTAANAGIDEEKAGLAAGLLNTGTAARRRTRAGGPLGARDRHDTSELHAGHGLA